MAKKDRDFFRQMIRELPEYEAGQLTDEEAEEIAEDIYANQEEIVKAEMKATISRELMRSVARGRSAYNPKTNSYVPRHVVDEEVSRGEATYDPQTGIYRRTH